ncbi:MAG: acyl-CoA dehydrogenase family protein [Rhodothermales bacterium]
MAYEQLPPTLGNQYDDDRVLRSYLQRTLPRDVLQNVEGEFRKMGELAGGPLYALQLADLRNEPVLTQWDAWGARIDRVETTRVWQVAERLATEYGLVALAFEQQHGAFSRIHQFALIHLFAPSTDIYSCPLAMTDGAARTLLASGNNALIVDALPHLTSRNPEHFWTSGQWMTELAGGSDVSRTETIARQDDGGTWRLYGRKWFTSAITSQMALVLARPEGNPSDSSGLALFFVELRDEKGRLRDIEINTLKDKLGTRKLPTAEITLNGIPAEPVQGLQHGVRAIATMLNITRTWNAVTAVALMRRGLALARDYARKREAFGTLLSKNSLHADTLAGLQAVYEGAFHLTFRVVELLGQAEASSFHHERGGIYHPLLRVLTPIAKLVTGKQVVALTSEVLEAFGGIGYVEDTGLPTLLRDAQVLPIWEGTTNILALDTLRALKEVGGLNVLKAEVKRCAEAVHDPSLSRVIHRATQILDQAEAQLETTTTQGRAATQAGARRFALSLGYALELALLARHAQWSLDHENDARAAAAAYRLATHTDLFTPIELEASFALANDTPLPVRSVTTEPVPHVTLSEVKPGTEWGDGAPPLFS